MNRILKNIVYHAPWLLSDKKFVELSWLLKTGKELDLKHPQTLNEKLQWLKVFDHRKDYFKMADKYEAKMFVGDIIGDGHIIPTIAIYDKPSDISWEELPDSFVLKCTHDSGGLVICRDKKTLNKEETEKSLKKCLRTKFYYKSREWCYKGIKPRIICEKLMSDSNQTASLTDYKFFCFNGEPKFLYISTGLENHSTASISFADMNGNRMPFHRSDFKEIADPLPFPNHFNEMKTIAGKLARAVGNSFIRVDLYEIDNTVYFSELTFYPNGGFIPFEPKEWDSELGKMLKIL